MYKFVNVMVGITRSKVILIYIFLINIVIISVDNIFLFLKECKDFFLIIEIWFIFLCLNFVIF